MTHLPRIAVIGTGGTISSVTDSPLDCLDYPEFGTKLGAADVLARTPEVALVAQAEPLPFRAVGSTAIGPADWLQLRDIIVRQAATGRFDGFVVLHGTATLEETAFFLNLTLPVSQTVVLVGAQRPASAVGSDGGANLLAALRVAGAPEARSLGVLVVLNDEIHAARDVVKTSTYRLQTFRSPDWGALGHVDGDGVQVVRRPARRHAPDTDFTGELPSTLPRVDVLLSYAGSDGALVEAAVAAGAKGLVSAGLAPGIATPGERAAFERAASSGIPVVQCSRAGSGRVGRRRYLREAGLIAGEDFSPQKARILLALALTRTADPVRIGAMFAEY